MAPCQAGTGCAVQPLLTLLWAVCFLLLGTPDSGYKEKMFHHPSEVPLAELWPVASVASTGLCAPTGKLSGT
jgi:hypothetical protein